jgi:hypothetical protein
MLDALIRHGIAAAVLASAGLDLPALIAAPERARELGESRCDDIVAQTLSLIRVGVHPDASADQSAGLSGLGATLDWSKTVEAGEQPRS